MPNRKKVSDMENYQVRTLQKKRTTNFREDETKLLISLWGSPVIQNKLYLTHRKAPVMRLLAANMQQRGFYRSPDEIKTRIRNLKCLYHRIKRTMVTGSGIGTVDPDWPHFKAMDAILGKEGNNKQPHEKKEQKEDNDFLEGPRCEDIKQEMDLDISDDMESWMENESVGYKDFTEKIYFCRSDFGDQHISVSTSSNKPPIPILPNPEIATPVTQLHTSQQLPTILPNFAMPTAQPTAQTLRTANGMSSIPLPLLILNHGIQPQPPPLQDKRTENSGKGPSDNNADSGTIPSDLNNILKEMLNVQKQQLEVDKQRFELEKQRLDFDRVVGSQLMTLIPMIGGLLQRLVYSPVAQANLSPDNLIVENNEADPKTNDKPLSDYEILKDSKILRTVLERGIKKYMMADETTSNKDNEEESENEDSGIHNNNEIEENENSNSSSK